MQLAATLCACCLAFEVTSSALHQCMSHGAEYPAMDWDEAVPRMATGDLVTLAGGIRRPLKVVLVVRDPSGVLYGLTRGRPARPLAALIKGSCMWHALSMAHAERGSAHHQVVDAVRRHADPFEMLTTAGVLSNQLTTLDLINCNTTPGYRYQSAWSVAAPPCLLEDHRGRTGPHLDDD